MNILTDDTNGHERTQMSRVKPAPDDQISHARQHLQMGAIIEVKKNEAVYSGGSDLFYMVVSGRVKIIRQDSDEANPALIAFCVTDDFFGEGVLVGQRIATESAFATEPTRVMTWRRDEIMATIAARQELAIALMQIFIRRTLHLESRVQTLCCDSVPKRIGRGVVDLARRMGTPADNNGKSRTVEVGNLSHQILGQYVGVTREVVSVHMARFKAAGDVDYERNGIIRVKPDAFAAKLDKMA